MAIEIAVRDMKKENERLRMLRDMFFGILRAALPDVKLNGHPELRLAGNLNVCISGISSEALIIALTDDVAISSGSACTTAAVEPSHVLKAIGLSDTEIHSSIRAGIGRTNDEQDIVIASERLTEEVERLRGLA